MTPLRLIAQVKFKLMRVNPYVQLANTALLVFLAGWHDWYLYALGGLILAYLFEKHFGLKGEMDMTWKNSEEWQKFKVEWQQFRDEWDKFGRTQ